MGQIENSPLIEAIFEIKWGEMEQNHFVFSKDESDFFPGIFLESLKKIGFSHFELLNSENERPSLPYEPKHRFRKEENKWPCFQIGLGLFTANQVGNLSIGQNDKDEYDWDTFKPTIVRGLESLNNSYPSNILGLNKPRVSLRFQDGFLLNHDTFESFVSNKIKANIEIYSLFTDQPNITKSAKNIKLDFVYETTIPKGTITISVMSAHINGERGVVIDTTVSSKFETGTLSVDILSNWCEEAHDLQRHSFATLISKNDL